MDPNDGPSISCLCSSVPLGELPPPPLRACFGRDGLVEEIVGLAENLEPIALIGAGGIGKTSIALSVLCHDRVVERFGDNRRFIRCDQFPASRLHFLARLSQVIGAGVENPEDLKVLQPFLSSREIFIVLDNAESILDPQGENAQEISAVMDQLCQFRTKLCLCITSRIATVPRYCKRPKIPTLSMEAACDIFCGIYGDRGRSPVINDLLQRLDFHALSITLLATAASHNLWDPDRLAKEWETHRAQVLRTDYNESLAATIELSLASPTFLQLGSDAHDLLGVVAFFPQGVDENNLDWLFPTISNRKTIFDKFCVLSLTYRSNGFVTTLAPIRDYLCPRYPKSSSLLLATRDRYFTRLSVDINHGKPGYEEARWIISEDVNVEHLLNIFTSIDSDSEKVWDSCVQFMGHLYLHKPRHTMLGPKIEGLPDCHPSKPRGLYKLASLPQPGRNREERKRLITDALKLGRERGDDFLVANILRHLSEANRQLRHYGEGIEQAREASGIFGRLGDPDSQAKCLIDLAWLFLGDEQFDAAEDAASRVLIDLASKKGQEFIVCQSHRVLGKAYRSKGQGKKAIQHLEEARAIASASRWHHQLFLINFSLTGLFLSQGEFGDADAHITQAKSYVANHPHDLGRAMELQARSWYMQRRFEDAKYEALRALEILEKSGIAEDVQGCKSILKVIEKKGY